MSGTLEHVDRYLNLGWALVGIPAGSKAPTTFGWQQRSAERSYWEANPSHNVGLLHSLSGTVALDIDDVDGTRLIFDGLNIDLDAILETAPRIVGRPDRGKVLFAAPVQGPPLTTRKISWPVPNNPRRTAVVFELRAGSVQDVLPPSIHPDTGQPYKWAGPDIANGLPPIPAQLLTIWREWDRFRPQIADLCPHASKREFTPPPKARRSEGQSVIAQYNAAVPIEEALTRAKYTKIGNRWLSPNSTSKIPGVVVFDDGRAYSHHASDPFDPEHAFDAFELFCTYEHAGNVSTAVKAAVEVLELESLPEGPTEQERDFSRHGASVAAQIMGQAVAPKNRGPVETDTVPEHLLNVPGVLGGFVDWASRTCIKPQPQFDVQAALAFGAVVLGQRFITSGNNMASLFFLNVGKTGTGKEHAFSVINRVLRHAGLDHLLGPAGYTSEGGVLSALHDSPAHIAVIDEFGNYLSAAGNKASVHQQQALSMMMECFGRQTDVVRNRGYSTVNLAKNQKQQMQLRINNPSLTVLAMTTPETFYDAISGKDVASGLLNRFLIVESKLPRTRSRNPRRVDPPDSVIAWAKMCATTSAGDALVTDQGPELPPVPVELEITKAAHELLDEYESELIDRQNAARSETDAAMLNRSREIAMRVALIVSVSLGLDEVDDVATRWAIDYVDFYAQRNLQVMADNLAEGDTDSLRKKVAAAIQKAGPSGMKMAELIRAVSALGNLKKHDRDGLLAMVCEDFPVERTTSKNGPGRPSIVHTWSE